VIAQSTLRADGLGKRFGSRVALNEVSFDLRAGELVGIVGPNGAGKTTLLSILAGSLAPDTGSLTFGGPVGGGASGGGSARGERVVGWVPQTPALYAKLTVAENLRLFARLEGVADVEATVARMLSQTALADRAGDPVGRLSGGNRQRVNIAIGLLSEPAVLLLDEPSAALDPRQRTRLWEFITTLAGAGTTIAFSTHDVSEVERFAGRVLLLADGELLFTGTPAQLSAAVGPARGGDLEGALLRFLAERGH
jgi:ABC-2 type transport system ATP-binding protein